MNASSILSVIVTDTDFFPAVLNVKEVRGASGVADVVETRSPRGTSVLRNTAWAWSSVSEDTFCAPSGLVLVTFKVVFLAVLKMNVDGICVGSESISGVCGGVG